MHPSLINPYIRIAMQSIIPLGHNIMRRVIYDYELIYLERGEFTLIYDDIPYHCHAGDIIFIRPGIAHSFQIDYSEISQPHIHFDITYRPQSDTIPISFKDIDNMTEIEKGWIHKNYFLSYACTPLITVKNKTSFLDIFYRIISNESDPLMKKAFMIQIISILINENFSGVLEEQTYFNVADQIKDYLDAGNGLGMSLDDFAKRFFHDKFYLEKKFKQKFGIGLIKYRNHKRMDFAYDLLDTLSVSKAAEMLGYQSVYSFSRAYKQHYGVSPSKHKGKY